MSAAFTPGPWDADWWERIIRDLHNWSVFDDLSDDRREGYGYPGYALDDAPDARLIASAPDGYDAAGAFLMAAIEEWNIPADRANDEGWLCDTLGHALAGAFLKAMAFRAKARGGNHA